MPNRIRKCFDTFSVKPVRFFFVAALLWMTLMYFSNSCYGIQWKEIFVEANGMVFDLLVFGILLSSYEALRDKKDKIIRLYEEIDDYREWPEKEAMFRIMGTIRRLVKEGEKKINLSQCYLAGAKFGDWNLSCSQFDSADLTSTIFCQTILKDSSFKESNLKNTEFHGTDLTGADFTNADLENAVFLNAILSDVNLEGAIVQPLVWNLEEIDNKMYPSGSNGWFRSLEKKGVEGLVEIENKYYIDRSGRLRLKSEMKF
jgi:hypothetical protein